MEVGCYTLHLYCDHSLPPPAMILQFGCLERAKWEHEQVRMEFTGQTEAECKKEARQAGWRFHRDGKHSCPLCTKYGRRELRPRH